MAALASRVATNSSEFRANAAAYDALIATLRVRHATVLQGGGERLAARHRERGKVLVRERIELLVDPLTPFLELSPLAAWGLYGGETPSAGIVTGIGIISGQPCMIIANDATVKGGSFFHETVKKHLRAQEVAREAELPCVYLVDCGGAFLPEQDRVFPDRDHFGGTFYQQCQMSAEGLPQISAVFGACTAGGAYIPALSDQVVMVRGTGRIHLGGPPIVKAAINEIVDGETLGGARCTRRCRAFPTIWSRRRSRRLKLVRELVGALQQPSVPRVEVRPTAPPRYDPEEIGGIVGCDLKRPYDVRDVLARMVDDSRLQEFKPAYGASLVCGFAHIHGYPVGILANNGVLFSESAVKGAHFIELCDQRDVPLLFLQNITGFMVGVAAERGGIAKHSAKLVYAVSNARTPKFTIVIGGSYGAGNYGMCGRGFRPRLMFAWPNARIATMSADVGSTVVTELRRQSISRGAVGEAELQRLEAETRAQFEEQSDPYYATARLWDDGLIEPPQTRDVIGLSLALAARKIPRQANRPVYRM